MAGTMELEREIHNAQIQERYRRILEAEESQFDGRSNVQASVQAPAYVNASTYTAPIVNNTPVMEQTPSVVEFPSLMDSPVFTTEKYNNLEENIVSTPVVEDMIMPATPVMQVAGGVEAVERFSLTAKAKMVIGAVCATFVMMFSMVGINTQIINKNAKQIKNLEKVRKQLMDKNEELQTRIEMAQSEETIREYALSQGMIEG